MKTQGASGRVRAARALAAAVALPLSGAWAGDPTAASSALTVVPGAALAVVHEDKTKFFECPVWDYAHGVLYFDSYNKKTDQLVRCDASGTVMVQPGTEGVGGAFLARDGRILAADCNLHRVLTFAAGAEGLSDPKVLAQDAAWHQPNDLCEAPSGHIYVTDPDFKGKKSGSVLHLAPSGRVTKVVSHLPCPNGIVVSNEGRTLYVSDSQLKEWWSFPILDDGELGAGRVFFKPETARTESPDGATIDELGNLYFTGMGGVWIVNPAGELLQFVPVPEFCSNVRIGGSDGKTLYITCAGKVYRLALRVRSGHGVAPECPSA